MDFFCGYIIKSSFRLVLFCVFFSFFVHMSMCVNLKISIEVSIVHYLSSVVLVFYSVAQVLIEWEKSESHIEN